MSITSDSSIPVGQLRCEYLSNPIGLDIRQPRLSWKLTAVQRAAKQTAFQVQAAESLEALTQSMPLLWNTGKVASDETLNHVYSGAALHSEQRCYWRVRVWDNDDRASVWSEPAFWEMGLLAAADWRADWIEPDWDEDPQLQHPCPYLRTDFAVEGRVNTARVAISSHGLYSLSVNGRAVTDAIFTPGYTAYEKRLQYQVYDVTALLRDGANAAGVILGDGWWRGKVGAMSVRNSYGTKLALLMQLHIVYTDGREQRVISDDHWRATTGPILMSDLKDGEIYDARLELPGWDMPNYDASRWRGVRQANYSYANLTGTAGVPVRRHETFQPALIKTPAGQSMLDMGQNFAGRVRMKLRGAAGATITLQHGETLDRNGNFTMQNLNLAGNIAVNQKVTYTFKGDGDEVFEPHFTFHGFRYVLVEGYPGRLEAGNFTGIAVYSDMPPTGTFRCSNPLVNQLQQNISWSQKSNFLDIPTDCPQRERAGWTGDAQIFARTGSFIMDTAAFYTKWLADLAAEQHADGMVTNLVPDGFKHAGGLMKRLEGSAGWGDAAVIIPWTVYQCYGDAGILRRQYASMKAWVDYVVERAGHTHWARKLQPAYWLSRDRRARQWRIWDTGYHWGEWLESGTGSVSLVLGILKRMLFSEPAVATPYLVYSSGLLARVADTLGETADNEHYQQIHEQAKAAYLAEYVGDDGHIRPDRQSSYVRALAFDLLPDDLRPRAARRLVELVRQNGNHLGTGFLTTTYLCHMLSRYGYLDVAYALLNQQTVPSWLYPVTKGATSIWETWDGIAADGTPRMSLNHYSYGAVGSWLYQVVAGIEIDPHAPGYKHFYIQPSPGGGLTHARAVYQSVRGQIVSAWQMEDAAMRLEIEVPPNTTATIRLPNARLERVTESGVALAQAHGISGVRQDESDIVCLAASGAYNFEYQIA